MSSIFNIVKNDLLEIGEKLNLLKAPILEVNKNNIDTHFSTSFALMNAKDQKTSPHVLANEIKNELMQKDYYASIEVAGPGFINIKIALTKLSEVLKNVITKNSTYGHAAKKNKTINIEYVSANPTGFLHVGHARNAVFGSVLEKILQADGYKTQTEYYVNDAGNQINILAITVLVHYLWLFNIKATKPENSYAGTFYDDLAMIIKEEYGDKFINAKFDDKSILDEQINDIFKNVSTTYFLTEIKKQLSAFGVSFDYFSSEKNMYETNQIDLLIDQLNKRQATYEKDGALWIKSSEYGDDKDRVLVKSDKSLTYFVPDLAMHNYRIKRSKADKLINIFGGDHHGYIARMRAGLQLLGYDPNILDIEIVQMVRVIKDGKEFKMSKRKGTAVWLIDIMEMVGKDALRYMLASKSASSHMDLDLDLVQQKNATNPVYYAQYAAARCNSIIKQAKEKNITPSFEVSNFLCDQKEQEILLTLDSFGQVISSSAKNKSVQSICEFIQTLAKQFHSYYADFKIIDEKALELSKTRLALIYAVLQVLSNAFDLVGIQTLTKM